MADLIAIRNKLTQIFSNGKYKELFDSIIKKYPNSNNKITAVCKIDNYQFMLKAYADDVIQCTSDRDKGKPSPFVEAEILRILNELEDHTPCIPGLILVHKMTERDYKLHHKSIKECINNDDPLCTIWNAINAKYLTGQPTFIITESGNIDLANFCKRACSHVDSWMIMSFIWLIIYTIGVIRKKYPDFEHGDLYARNIILFYDYEYIQDTRPGSSYYLKFDVNGKKYYVPYFGIMPRIIDFELSKLNSSLYSTQQTIGHCDDILQLLFSINNIYSTPNFVTVEIDKLWGKHIGFNLKIYQIAEIVHLKPIDKLLDLFGYEGEVPDDCIWGEWTAL